MLLVSDMNSQMPGGLGWRELILMAAIVLLLAGASRLTVFAREENHDGVEWASSRVLQRALHSPTSQPSAGGTRTAWPSTRAASGNVQRKTS
jgi:hypothetical protein